MFAILNVVVCFIRYVICMKLFYDVLKGCVYNLIFLFPVVAGPSEKDNNKTVLIVVVVVSVVIILLIVVFVFLYIRFKEAWCGGYTDANGTFYTDLVVSVYGRFTLKHCDKLTDSCILITTLLENLGQPAVKIKVIILRYCICWRFSALFYIHPVACDLI